MRILAIETSCDETAAAVIVETGNPARPWAIASSIVASQVEIHRAWGGVVPELASRQHVRDICGVVERALGDAAVGVGRDRRSGGHAGARAGRVPPRRCGICQDGGVGCRPAAGGGPPPGWSHRVDLAGPRPHAASRGGTGGLGRAYEPLPRAPEGDYVLLGRTRDDAAGEAYDKVAKLLGLEYPGGPVIDALAAEGNPRAVAWPGTRLTNPDRNAPDRDGRFDFSFSGLKTAVLRHVRHRQAALGSERLPADEVRDIAASFQRRVVDTLVERTFSAARWHRARSVGIAGGVSANSAPRREVAASGCGTGAPRLHSAPLAVDRQRGHDWRGRDAPAGPRRPRAARPQRRCVAGLVNGGNTKDTKGTKDCGRS